MMTFNKMTLREKLMRLWPPYSRRRDAEMLEEIRWLVAHPDAPCMIGDSFIPNGYNESAENG